MRDDRDCPSPDSTVENLLAPLAMSAPMWATQNTPQLAIPVDQPSALHGATLQLLKRCCSASIIANFAFN